jgi:threonine dehydrogenase-like Zn-dependent dehydrogenase
MKAIRYHQVGGPEALRLWEVPEPVVAPGEVRIRVRAAGESFADTERRRGRHGANAPQPRILASEVAGMVESVCVASTRAGRAPGAVAKRSYAEAGDCAGEGTPGAPNTFPLALKVSAYGGTRPTCLRCSARHVAGPFGCGDTGAPKKENPPLPRGQ